MFRDVKLACAPTRAIGWPPMQHVEPVFYPSVFSWIETTFPIIIISSSPTSPCTTTRPWSSFEPSSTSRQRAAAAGIPGPKTFSVLIDRRCDAPTALPVPPYIVHVARRSHGARTGTGRQYKRTPDFLGGRSTYSGTNSLLHYNLKSVGSHK
ncbi:hypothetical protein L210DRAFT_3631690, partial [Boletus edulis BED1]